MASQLSETWVIAVHEALAGFRQVALGQLVAGAGGYELVLTTWSSPPDGELVEALRVALGGLVGREDSPIAAAGEGWHFYPPVDERAKELFARLDWEHAVVVHEWVD